MIVADFHVHSTFSVDGMSTMEQHCIAAIQKGIKKICFTEHVDYNIAEYNVGKVKDNRKQNFDIKEYFNEIGFSEAHRVRENQIAGLYLSRFRQSRWLYFFGSFRYIISLSRCIANLYPV